SLAKEPQRTPALARRVTDSGSDYEYELVYGMRRRFACEFLNKPLKIEVTTADDQRCAVLMHIENADRRDITPMERAQSCARQTREGLFRTQEEMEEAKNLSKGMMTQLLKAAELLENEVIAQLFPDPTLVPVTVAYKLSAQMTASSADRERILSAAKHLAKQ